MPQHVRMYKGRPKKEGPRIGYNIDDLNRFALKQNSASYRPPARLHWQSFAWKTLSGAWRIRPPPYPARP
jgi:uncharacterized protein (DUF1684 family)